MKKIILAIFLVLVFGSSALATTTDFYLQNSTSYYGYSYRYGSPYPPSTTTAFTYGADMDIQKDNSGGTYYTAVACFKIDTSALPDAATITSAVLKLNVTRTSSSSRYCNIEYYSGNISNNCYSDLVGTDAAQVILSSFSAGTKEITLSNLTSINKTGYTGFRLGVSGGQPSYNNQNYIQISTPERTGTNPILSVTYTTGYSKKINGVTSAAKVNGVAVPTKVNGL